MVSSYRLNTIQRGRLVGVYTIASEDLSHVPAELPILTFRPDNWALRCAPAGGFEAFLRRPLRQCERAVSGFYRLAGDQIRIDWQVTGDTSGYESLVSLEVGADGVVRGMQWGVSTLYHVPPWKESTLCGRFVREASGTAGLALLEQFELQADGRIHCNDGTQGTYGLQGSWLRLVFDHTTQDFFVGLLAGPDQAPSDQLLLMIGDAIYEVRLEDD